MYWIVCDIDSLRNKADGESQYAAGAERRARGDFVFEVVLQGAIWDEGYRFWWDISNVRRLPEPITCRGNVGMWQLPESLAAKVSAQRRNYRRLCSALYNNLDYGCNCRVDGLFA